MFEFLKWAGIITLVLAAGVSCYGIYYYNNPQGKTNAILSILLVLTLVGLALCFGAIAVKN